MHFTSLSLCALALYCQALARTLPSFLSEKCKRDDPEFGKCVLKKAKEIFPHISSGDTGVKVMRMDPLHLDQISLTRERQGPTTIQAVINNATITGLKNLNFETVKIDLEKRLISMNVTLPTFYIKGLYNVTGKILLLPLSGTGEGTLTAEKNTGIIEAHYNLVKKTKNEHAEFDSVKVNFQISKMNIQLNNLFNGNEVLGTQVNKFLNENWEEVVKDFGPTVSDVIGQVAKQVLNQFFKLAPFKDMFD